MRIEVVRRGGEVLEQALLAAGARVLVAGLVGEGFGDRGTRRPRGGGPCRGLAAAPGNDAGDEQQQGRSAGDGERDRLLPPGVAAGAGCGAASATGSAGTASAGPGSTGAVSAAVGSCSPSNEDSVAAGSEASADGASAATSAGAASAAAESAALGVPLASAAAAGASSTAATSAAAGSAGAGAAATGSGAAPAAALAASSSLIRAARRSSSASRCCNCWRNVARSESFSATRLWRSRSIFSRSPTRERSSRTSWSREATCSCARLRSASSWAMRRASVPPAVPARSPAAPRPSAPARGGSTSRRESACAGRAAPAAAGGAAGAPAGAAATSRGADSAATWALTSSRAAAGAIAVIFDSSGIASVAPRRMRLMLPPMKACGFSRWIAIIIWSTVMVGRGRLAWAISHSVSPDWTVTRSGRDGSAGAGAGGCAGAGRAAAAGAGCAATGAGRGAGTAGVGAGAAAAGAGATGCAGAGAGSGAAGAVVAAGRATGGVGATTAGATRGGSSRMLYSRSSRPFAQLTSISTLTSGSRTGSRLVTAIAGRPPAPVTIANSSGTGTLPADRPTRAKSAADARRVWTPARSSAPTSRSGISARSGSLSPERTVIWPRPKACAIGAASVAPIATANRTRRIFMSPPGRFVQARRTVTAQISTGL